MQKSKVIEYLKTHELDIQSAVASYLALSVAFKSYSEAYNHLGFNYGPCFSYFEKNQNRKPYFHHIVSKKQVEQAADKVFLDYLRNPKSLDKFIENHQKAGEKAFVVWKNYKNNPKKDKKLLEQKFSEFLKAEGIFWHYTLAGEDKGEVINRKIVPIFAKLRKISQEKSRKIIQIISHPEEPAIFSLERKDFLRLCLGFVENQKTIAEDINKYLKKYFWFKTDFYGNKKFDDEVVVSEIKKEISENKLKEIKEEIKKIEENFLKIKEFKKDLLKKLKLNNEEKELINFATKFSLWIDQRKQWMMEQFFYLFDLTEEAARILKTSYEEISFCSREEIMSCLRRGKGLEKSTIKFRRGEFLVAFRRGEKETFFFGKDARDILKVALGESNKEIKGMVASNGSQDIVFGKARIIIHVEKEDFNQGEILITSMTRVEFVPLMKKASAIITDEGGMACHAAIVSRELGIPAIIGTKNATNAIQNGDQIEMNLKTGKIKIISKK